MPLTCDMSYVTCDTNFTLVLLKLQEKSQKVPEIPKKNTKKKVAENCRKVSKRRFF